MTTLKNASQVIETTIAEDASVSAHVKHDICRGLAVMPLAAWTAADIVFEFNYKGTWHTINDKTGVRLRISGVVADELNAAPSETWALGRFEFRLVSVAAGTETAAAQAAARTLVVAILE